MMPDPVNGRQRYTGVRFRAADEYVDEGFEMPAPTGPEVNRILIVANDSQPDTVKSAYNAAGSLRKAGFIVSIQVDSEDKSDFKWLIEVSGKSPDFVVINQANKHKQTPKQSGRIEAFGR